jgi:hypothetical protein
VKWPMLLLAVASPLQWFKVAGPLRLHIVVMLAFAVLVLLTHRARAFAPVLRVALPFVIANGVLCLVWMATNGYNGLGFRQPLQQLSYLAVFVAVATVVYRGVALNNRRFIELMRWAALITGVSLVVALSFSMITNGVNPGPVFAKTISNADPEILQKELFKTAFTGFGYDEDAVRGNIRHEVFGAVLVAMCLSAACVSLRPLASQAARVLYRFSIGLGALLIVLSMSRSVMIAAAVWPLLGALRPLLSGRLSPRVVGGGLLTIGLGTGLAVTGVVNVIWIRFTQDTSSYQARDNLLAIAYRNIVTHMLTGGVTTASESSHNFVIDSWLRSGIFGAAAALVAAVLVVGLLAGLAFNLHREPAWMLPVTAMLALPVVRMFTAGGGLIPPIQWVALGIVAGFLTYRASLRTAASAADPAPGLEVRAGR